MSSEITPDKWAITDEDWSIALGLPSRPGGWGLVMFRDGDRRWTWAGDPVIVTALDEREGALSNYDPDFPLEADGWPDSVPPRSGPRPLTWRSRQARV